MSRRRRSYRKTPQRRMYPTRYKTTTERGKTEYMRHYMRDYMRRRRQTSPSRYGRRGRRPSRRRR